MCVLYKKKNIPSMQVENKPRDGEQKIYLFLAQGQLQTVTAKERFNLLFFRVRRRREMKLKIEDDDDDVVRTSVSQDRVTATLCPEELFLCTQHIKLSTHIGQVKCGGGMRMVNTTH
jgi:hypothetical protein